jgi:hypothetical protein
MVDSPEGNRILGLMNNKVHFLEEMLKCSKLLADITFENHETEYNNLLETREQCIEVLKNIESTLQAESKNSEVGMTGIVCEEVASLNNKAERFIKEIIVLDQQNETAITIELQSVKTKIEALKRGRKGIAGYQATGRINAAGIYTDNRK